MGIVAGGWQMARAALAAEKQAGNGATRRSTRPRSPPRASTPTTSWSQAPGLRNTVVNGAAGVMALSEDQFLAA